MYLNLLSLKIELQYFRGAKREGKMRKAEINTAFNFTPDWLCQYCAEKKASLPVVLYFRAKTKQSERLRRAGSVSWKDCIKGRKKSLHISDF